MPPTFIYNTWNVAMQILIEYMYIDKIVRKKNVKPAFNLFLF